MGPWIQKVKGLIRSNMETTEVWFIDWPSSSTYAVKYMYTESDMADKIVYIVAYFHTCIIHAVFHFHYVIVSQYDTTTVINFIIVC